MSGYIDINTSPFQFDSQSDLVYPGTWYRFGCIDGQNSFVQRTLDPPFDVFQEAYDEGFAHGTWNRQYTFQTKP